MWKEFELGVHVDRIQMKPYEGFIFICGGPSDVREAKPISVRDALQRALVRHSELYDRVRVAEHYKDWSSDSVYADLLDFESHIAQLSSVIVLILESAGSIAELGLFSAIDEFKEKLLVVIEAGHYNEPSFIKLGPIDYLEKTFKNMAECHRWTDANRNLDHHALSEVQGEIVDAIKERIRSSSTSRPFNPKLWSDIALVICELVSIFSALTFKEIKSHLRALGADISEPKLHQFLYILERLDFVFKEPKGAQRFYVSRDQRSFATFESKSEGFDLMRFRAEVISNYSREDKKRFRAVQEVRRRHAV